MSLCCAVVMFTFTFMFTLNSVILIAGFEGFFIILVFIFQFKGFNHQ